MSAQSGWQSGVPGTAAVLGWQSADQSAARSDTSLAERPQFTSGVALVALDVCVRNRDGHPTAGLKPEDFLILENNVPQRIAQFSTAGRVPLAVVLLVDNSRSMFGGPLERAKTAASGFIDILRPEDLVEVVSFNERAHRRYALGADHAQAKQSLDAVSAAGATRLYEAVLVALRELEHARRKRTAEYRNVMIVLSDGEDTSSHLPFEDVLEEVRRAGVLIYTISLRKIHRDGPVVPLWQMALLARDTGGQAVAIHDLNGLTQSYRDINTELVNLYRIGYVPSPPVGDGSWRAISVRVPVPTFIVRTRAGYYAPWIPSKSSQESKR